MKKRSRIYRSRKSKVIAGVCGGLSEYLNIDVVIIRAVFLVALIGYGTGLLAYIVLWIMMPREKRTIDDYSNFEEIKND